jgi:hypothetical protein
MFSTTKNEKKNNNLPVTSGMKGFFFPHRLHGKSGKIFNRHVGNVYQTPTLYVIDLQLQVNSLYA